MAEIDNFTVINENFDTVKTLLNSIRAQGILNTSDVDKLLSGINNKLEKINTEEDIDLIKIFLSELKQNLEERHGILISKFGAIEGLFTNLLKNSSELIKSSEIKELFDIVATNLSVFSREVVSQKESLTDIALRIDAIRSDDSQKKDIIKNITFLKSDLERLNNGFDSIVINLNENFKTLIKTINSIDKSEHLDKFADSLNNIEISSNTVFSALQMLDKKTEQVENALTDLAKKEDLTTTNKKIIELIAQSHDLTDSINTLTDSHRKFDNLSEKIDASVGIIANLKSILEDTDDKNTRAIIEELVKLENEVIKITSDTSFNDFKMSLEVLLSKLSDNISTIDKNIVINIEKAIKDLSDNENSNLKQVLTNIAENAASFNEKIKESQADISSLCESNFNSIYDSIIALKLLISQIDENSTSANNAIFSNISDRLAAFENNLKISLETQEKTVSDSTNNIEEHFSTLKNLTTILDYKMDTSTVEVGNIKRELDTLKTSVDKILAQDFVTAVNDLRIDLYASKQEISNSLENSSSDLSEKFTNDIYSKYELLISKLDSVDEEFKKTQSTSLNSLKVILDNISSSIVDVLSYVSEQKPLSLDGIDSKIITITDTIKENNLNYIENVRDIVEEIKTQIEDNLLNIETNSTKQLDEIKNTIQDSSENIKNDIKYSYSKLLEIQDLYNQIQETINANNETNQGKFSNILLATDDIKNDIETKICVLKNSITDKIGELKKEFTIENTDKMSEIKFTVENSFIKNSKDLNVYANELKNLIQNLGTNTENINSEALTRIIDNFTSLKEYIKTIDSRAKDELASKVDLILDDFSTIKTLLEKVDENVDGDMTRQLSIIESNFESLISQITILFEKSDISISDQINNNFTRISDEIQISISDKLDNYKSKIEETFDNLSKKTIDQSNYLQERIAALNTAINSAWETQANDNLTQINSLTNDLKNILNENIKITTEDYQNLRNKMNDLAKDIATSNEILTQDIKVQLDDILKYIDNIFEIQTNEIKNINQNHLDFSKNSNSQLSAIVQLGTQNNEASQIILANAKTTKDDILALAKSVASNKVSVDELNSTTQKEAQELKDAFTNTNSETQSKIAELSEKLNSEIAITKNELSQIILNTQLKITEFNDIFTEKINLFKEISIENSASEIKVLEEYSNQIISIVNTSKDSINTTKDLIQEFIKKELGMITQNVEKETDVIIAEIIEQFELLKKSQADDVINISSKIEEIISSQIYENIEDLKSYLDIKTDNSLLTNKLDTFKSDLTDSISKIITDLSKLLDSNAFTNAITDFRLANEVLVTSAVDTLNDKIETFINENIKTITNVLADSNDKIENKFDIFDKKFIETLVDKFEEIKILSNSTNNAFNGIKLDINDILTNFENIKENISKELKDLLNQLNNNTQEIRDLNASFENLKSQLANKAFEEEFQNSINKQINSLESLINEQFSYIEDISELCSNNLPDVSEMNILVKHTIIESLNNLSEKLNNQNVDVKIETELKNIKSDIITQLLNIFNQISFVTEEEEILDFIQEKHDELIDILSHIITSNNNINVVNDNIVTIDSKITSLKNEIGLINNKINTIISAEDDVDYIYSLQDLESDIANLRLALNEIKENNSNNEFSDLISSTNEIYALVESVKSELPSRKDFDLLAEDVLSISTRTNKLLLASDESYKSLQDNLQDFKLVINDLDERTRNFAEEAGLNRIDSKLNALNNMMQNGAKSNQVFNQIFEYLAEWVDNASTQIQDISERVETLDDIDQIKSILSDIKTKTEDNSDNIELIDALSTVFDKQIKRFSALETKMDKIIVETTIKDNKPDLGPIEATINKFLVTIDEKMTEQQNKINSLEAKLENALSIIENKDTAQLTKKMGGMDRQIAKLNKSIEKIASHVVEK